MDTPARQKIVQSYTRGAREQPDQDAFEGVVGSQLRRIPNPKGYQATEESQIPKPTFPSTLASYVLVFEMDDEWRAILEHVRINGEEPPKGGEDYPVSYARMNMQPLVDKLRSADMIVRESISSDQQSMICLISISEKRQKQVAEVMGEELMRLRLKKKDDYGNPIKNGGGWAGFKQQLAHLYEKSSEGSLFSSAQQCAMMEFMLNDVDERAMGPQLLQKEACEPGETPLSQLVNDLRIKTYFCLHHKKKREWLASNWVSNSLGKQPIEDVREYYGEEVALFFVFNGYLMTMLWVPAAVGLLVGLLELIAEVEDGTVDNPFIPLYAIYISMWAVQFVSGWKRIELAYQMEWGTVDLEPPEDDRTAFVQSNKTYKRHNDVSKKEEFFPDPIWRSVFIVASCVAVTLFCCLNVATSITCEVLKSVFHRALGGEWWTLVKIVGALLQAGTILLYRFLATFLFDNLTNLENWKTEKEYHTATVAKRMCFGYVNSYFPLIFGSFIINHVKVFGIDISCPDNDCIDYVEILMAIVFTSQVLHKLVAKVAIPMFRKRQQEEEAKERADLDDMIAEISDQEMQMELPEFQGLENDYSSKLIEIGYFMFFGADFPILCMLLLIITAIDIRVQANVLVSMTQRVPPKVARDIGEWCTTLDVWSVASILIQSCFIGYTSQALRIYLPDMSSVEHLFAAVAIEHALLLFKIMWDSKFSDVPDEVQLAYERKNYERDVLLKNFDTPDFEKKVGFYTEEEGHMYYGKVQE